MCASAILKYSGRAVTGRIVGCSRNTLSWGIGYNELGDRD